jgi:hypothetical protein
MYFGAFFSAGSATAIARPVRHLSTVDWVAQRPVLRWKC